MKLKIYITLVVTLLSTVLLAQEATLEVSVSKNKLGVNQRFRVLYAINKQGGDNFTPPNFENFRIVGGPSQSVSQSWVNGKSSFSKSYTYVLQPKREGQFNLPPASIDFDGKTIKSKALKIIVTKAVEIPKNPNDPNYIAQQKVHLVAEISKSNPYVNEAVYLEYRLYFSQDVSIYDYAVRERPQFNGFWHQEIKKSSNSVKSTMYNGQRYHYAVLSKSLLIPTKSGKFIINPMKMDVSVAVSMGRRDFWGNTITRNVQLELASATKAIVAKKLPLENQPSNFNGAVGDFKYNVSLSKNILKANESSQIKVTVAGKGNLKLFELPKVTTPQELETYDPERKEKTIVGSTGIRGSIAEIYTVVPQYKGKYKIPSTSFSYFNPKDKKYHTVTKNDLYVEVTEGKELPQVVNQQENNSVNKQLVKSTGKNFRYIQTKTDLKSLKKSKFFNSLWYYILLILPLICIPVVVLLSNKKKIQNKDVALVRSRKSERLAKKYLSEAQKNLNNKEKFYESLERALHNYLKSKLAITTSEISHEKITQILDEKGIGSQDVKGFVEVLRSCDFARYTPVNDTQMKVEFNKAKEIITNLDRQL